MFCSYSLFIDLQQVEIIKCICSYVVWEFRDPFLVAFEEVCNSTPYQLTSALIIYVVSCLMFVCLGLGCLSAQDITIMICMRYKHMYMYINTYIYIYASLSLSLSLSPCIYIDVCAGIRRYSGNRNHTSYRIYKNNKSYKTNYQNCTNYTNCQTIFLLLAYA